MEAQILNFKRGEHRVQYATHNHSAERTRRICAFPVQTEHQRPQEHGLQSAECQQV
ncbi:hypothetical protein D3C80_2189350 [compost metagenome]